MPPARSLPVQAIRAALTVSAKIVASSQDFGYQVHLALSRPVLVDQILTREDQA